MKDQEFKKKMEIAKSWFVLAQIAIILSGFFFASSGILFDAEKANFNQELSLVAEAAGKDCSQISNPENYQNAIVQLIDTYNDSGDYYRKMSKEYLYWGIIFTVLSFCLWLVGHWKINKMKLDN